MKQLEFNTKIIIKLIMNRLNIDLQYRTDFLISLFETIFSVASVFIIIELMYLNTNQILNWSKQELYLLYGLANLCAAIYFTIFNGISSICYNIVDGHLDYILLKPFSVILDYIGTGINSFNSANIISGLFVLVYALNKGASINIFYIIFSLVLTQLLLFSINLILQTLNFYTIFVETASEFTGQLIRFSTIPYIFYNSFFQKVFSFVLPIFITGGLAIAINKQIVGLEYLFWSGLSICIIFIFALKFWNIGLKNYSGASS